MASIDRLRPNICAIVAHIKTQMAAGEQPTEQELADRRALHAAQVQLQQAIDGNAGKFQLTQRATTALTRSDNYLARWVN